MDFALSNAALYASTVLMSGFGAPARTERPSPASTNGVAVPATTLPFRISSSIGAGLLVMRSEGPLEFNRRSSAEASSWITVTLCPLARSNAAASSRTPGVAPWLVKTTSSAATAVRGSDPVAPKPRPATRHAAAKVLPAFMAPPSACCLGSQIAQSHSRSPREAYAVLRLRASRAFPKFESYAGHSDDRFHGIALLAREGRVRNAGKARRSFGLVAAGLVPGLVPAVAIMLRCAIPIEIAGQASRCGVSAAPVASGSP